jgi:DNA gyrase subunit B
LYKIKRGKKERYLKDDAALEAFLLEASVRNLSLFPEGLAPLIGEPVKDLIDRIRTYVGRIERASRRVVPDVSDAWYALGGHVIDRSDDAKMKEVADGLVPVLERIAPGLHVGGIEMETDEDLGTQQIVVYTLRDGEERVSRLGGTPESEHMKNLVASLHEDLPLPLRLQPEGEPMHSWRALLSLVMEQARKGYEIQRYKGLGEMNPDQLWDTTMNPETRTLLQVGVENMTQADHIFSVLMGDAVDPRRNFIQENALNVRNLDI